MKHIKLIIVGILLLIGLFLLASDVQHLRSCCGGTPPPQPPPPPPPPPPQPPKPPAEAPPSPEPPKPPTPEPPKPPTPEPPTPEPPKPEPPTPTPPTPTPPTPPEPPTPTPPTPTPPATPPPPTTQPNPTGPTPEQPTAPTQPTITPSPTPGLTVKSPVAQAVSRPSLSGGLMPLIRSLKAGTASLLGVVESWEVWWTRNRDNYLSFRQSIEWAKVVSDSGSTSITIYPGYEEALKILDQAISDKNHHIAMRAAVALGKTINTKNPVSIRVIETLKKANGTETRYFVTNNILLGSSLSGDNSFVALIKEVAQNKTTPPLRRCYAILAMGNITNDPELPKIMRKILTDQDDTEVKSCACLSLSNLKDTSAVPILGKLLNGSDGRKEQQVVRAYAALGLGRIGTKEALNELKRSTPASERDTDVLSAVVIALGLIGSDAKDSILPFLTHKNAILRGEAAISLAQTKDAKSYDLISEAFKKNSSNENDGLMLLALALTGNDKAKADLRKLLSDKKSRSLLKAAAAIGLGLLKDNESVQTIVDMLYTKEGLYNVVLAPYLILSLGMIQDQKAVEVLQKIWDKIEEDSALLPYHTNLAVALTLLGKRDEIVLPKLTQHLNLKQPKNILLRSYTLHTLGLVGKKESVLAFVEAYKDNNTYVRFETIAGLGFLLDGSNISPLNKITENNIDIPMIIMNHIMLIPVW
ncbi:MAG: HEAT repeat domain-containing protein [Planctomycetota bacterium]